MSASKPIAGLVLILFSWGALAAGSEPPAKTTLVIKGMTCGGCVAAVKVQLKKTPGVTAYEVSLEKGEAVVTFDSSRTDPKKIAESVSKTGFQATVKGEAKAEALPEPTPVANLDLGRLREWFNASSGSVRVISLLSPT
jgi:copper chaperone